MKTASAHGAGETDTLGKHFTRYDYSEMMMIPAFGGSSGESQRFACSCGRRTSKHTLIALGDAMPYGMRDDPQTTPASNALPTIAFPDFGAMLGNGTINQACYAKLQVIAGKLKTGDVSTLTQDEYNTLQQVIAGNVGPCNESAGATVSLSSVPWWGWVAIIAGGWYLLSD